MPQSRLDYDEVIQECGDNDLVAQKRIVGQFARDDGKHNAWKQIIKDYREARPRNPLIV
jgi:hypothetical protein